jgi:hypothetical protein
MARLIDHAISGGEIVTHTVLRQQISCVSAQVHATRIASIHITLNEFNPNITWFLQCRGDTICNFFGITHKI